MGSSRPCRYQWWRQGILLRGTVERPLALDTETEIVQSPLHIPRLALATASDGDTTVLIHPDQIGAFLLTHKGQHIVGHNLQFDFWVLQQHTQGLPRRTLWDMADQGKLHDTMLLDQLYQLGTVGVAVKRDLGTVATEYAGLVIDKTDPYRLRYGELLGLTEAEIDGHVEAEGFLSYASKDAMATYIIYPAIRAAAVSLMVRAGWSRDAKTYAIRPDALDKWGPLGEQIQVRASITLAHLSRKPLRIDLEARQRLEDEYRGQLRAIIDNLDRAAPGVFKRYKSKARAGQYKLTKKSRLPSIDQSVLIANLETAAKYLGVKPILAGGKKGGVSTSAKAWRQYAESSEFIKNWCDLEHVGKRVQMLAGLAHQHVYTNYALLMRTGRTSASKHKDASVPGMNLQQMPKEKQFRRLLLADEGKWWAAVDFAYIELRTLAATCLGLLGYSRLAEIVREHTAAVKAGRKDVPDPHQTTGAGLVGVSVQEFVGLPPAEQEDARQKAKPVNFGYPGGLGYKRFVDYAKANYGLNVSEKEAKRFKKQWLTTYPEMEAYLADRTVAALGGNLGLPPKVVAKQFSRLAWEVRRTISGEQHTQRIWDALKRLAALNPGLDTETKQLLALPGGSPELERRLLTLRACTLTGRVRAGCKYTDSKNTPFQGLAADGAKEAIWDLMYRGYDVVAFVHDEIIVQVASDRDVPRIQAIMCAAMEQVLGHDIPVACRAACGPHWMKD